MSEFFGAFAPSFVSILLISSGADHAFRWKRFARSLASHRIVPNQFVLPLSVAVTALELLVGGGVLAGLIWTTTLDWAGFAASAALALAMFVYVARLLIHAPAQAVKSCGCSPFATPLNKLSLLPSIALLAFSVAGLIITLPEGAPNIPADGLAAVTALLAALVMLVALLLAPASAPHALDPPVRYYA